ncbi:hypothetical protein [Variovorax boronicumulans]|uniref:hypothetical protein n=1 Tax=Variovorax boronicumulans TaxID=436515 RepID=UPI00132FB4DB|nr:hypothetical protein [Variovorax boronicumulans]
MNTWKVEIQPEMARNRAVDSTTVPLKWAHDAQTGEPRYIHDPEVAQAGCTCICPACKLSLIPVMAGQPLRTRPTAHFRHPAGAQKDDCSLVAARLAATRHLLEIGFIDLPRRRMSATAEGFSGQGYEVWVEAPAARVAVIGASLHDHATALLTLDDGRELLVDLTGLRQADSDGRGHAIVTLSLSDPTIAMLGPEEIRARLRILPDIRWCAHWNDQELSAEADAAATQAARDALDGWQESDEADFRSHLPPDTDATTMQRWRRETLLHRQVKAILEQASSIATPGLEVEVIRDPPEEFGGDWEEERIRKLWMTASRNLALDEVRLERRLGSIVPDVIGTLGGRQTHTHGGTMTMVSGDFEEDVEDTYSPLWPLTLLVEVTVTHGIDAEKLRRIRELDLPTLEINIGSLGGQVTLDGLRTLVVDKTIGKRWVHHPVWRIKRKILEAEMARHPVTLRYQKRLIEIRRPLYLATSASKWAGTYLSAAIAFYDANTGIKKARRAHGDSTPKPTLLGPDSEPWAQIMAAAEALAAHGLPGAADAEMVDEAGVIPRLLSIQQNRGIGYAVDTGFQVLNAIMQSGTDTRQWHTLYPMAVKAFGLEARFTQKQADLYAAWRQTIIDKVAADDESYLRPARYDPVLSMLFPEMAPRIATGYGRATASNMATSSPSSA